jgi:hypothetical protein
MQDSVNAAGIYPADIKILPLSSTPQASSDSFFFFSNSQEEK